MKVPRAETPMSDWAKVIGASSRPPLSQEGLGGINTGALMIRIGCWGPLYHNYNKYGAPKIVLLVII